MALCQASKTVVWAAQWLQKLHFLFLESAHISLKGDNLGANGLIKNSKHHVRTKHIDVQYHYIKEMIELGIVNVNYVLFFQNAADILIKSLDKTKFSNGLKLLGFTE